MKRIFLTVVVVVVMVCSLLSFDGMARSDDALTDEQMIDQNDIEIINDLDLFQNWDELQNAKVFEESDDQITTGVDHEA